MASRWRSIYLVFAVFALWGAWVMAFSLLAMTSRIKPTTETAASRSRLELAVAASMGDVGLMLSTEPHHDKLCVIYERVS